MLEPADQGLDPKERIRHIIASIRYEDHGYYFIYGINGSVKKTALRISSLSQSRLYALLKKHGLQKRQCHNNE